MCWETCVLPEELASEAEPYSLFGRAFSADVSQLEYVCLVCLEY